MDFVRDYSGETLHAVTIALPSSFIPQGRLSRFAIEDHKRSLRYRLSKAGCGLLFGVIEFDFVEHSTGRYPAGWLPHFHGLLAASDLPALRSRFKSAIVRTDVVLRPVKVKEWDGLKKWLRYCSKINLKRRLGFDGVERFNTKTAGARFCRVTKTKDLLSEHFAARAAEGRYPQPCGAFERGLGITASEQSKLRRRRTPAPLAAAFTFERRLSPRLAEFSGTRAGWVCKADDLVQMVV
jgi:hypothetical protein